MADTENAKVDTADESKPPKPPLVLSVGMIGHRLLRGAGEPPAFDAAAVEAAMARALGLLGDALAEVAERHSAWFSDEKPVLATINALGEGADVIAFDVAGRLGLARDVILPAAPEAYAATFVSPQARDALPGLLAQARSTLILPPLGDMADPKAAARSFEQAALTLLEQSDLLIAVWDGEPARGCGGVGDTVDEAARAGAPLLAIDPKGAIRLCEFGDNEFPVLARHADELSDRDALHRLGEIVERLVAPPQDPPEESSCLAKLRSCASENLVALGESLKREGWPRLGGALERMPCGEAQREGLRLFYATPSLGRKRLPVWDFLRKGLLWRHRVDLRPAPDFDLVRPDRAEPLADARNQRPFQFLLAAHGAADRIADHYAHAFRSAFVINFVFGAIAVAFVGAAMASAKPGVAFPLGELLCLALVVGLVMVARLRHWRRRWFEAREAAERLRASQPFWPLGAWPMSLHLRQPGWPGWYARAILRSLPVFHGDLNRSAPAAGDFLKYLIVDQHNYHKTTAARARRCDGLLEAAGFVVLLASFYVLGKEIAHAWSDHSAGHPDLGVRFWAVTLPAVATAFYGIRLLSDFEDTEIRSRRAMTKLEKLETFLKGKAASDLRALRTRARQLAKTMLDDLENWRITVESRNISA